MSTSMLSREGCRRRLGLKTTQAMLDAQREPWVRRRLSGRIRHGRPQETHCGHRLRTSKSGNSHTGL